MRRQFVITAVVLGSFLADALVAQSVDPRQVRLRGNRFRPLTYDEMSPAQRTFIEHILTGPRGSADGPFNVQLRSPEMSDLGQQFGAATRFATSVPRKLYELAILITARLLIRLMKSTAVARTTTSTTTMKRPSRA